ncbi:hypothetical protein ACNFCJ_23900 [Pseudomonas sp. NY15364]|uniref:hypothetical protein n=1 Tax=unclassified Pseudomonas TaxID=196821 RepID=UPI000CC3FE0C|nr:MULTISPECIES: hypothetical protein [Pseudomonas]PKQ41828.1 hypothetical protein CXP40_10005 [Pseudomonas sp. YY-1]TRO10964.1 hypothetical protein EQ828_24000 [Pseudomonas mendocina]TRO19036.1 hypothetical protein EQ826_24330 [Pseudomonas mendocina]
MLLRRLFSHARPMRHFALIDDRGVCCALRQMQEHPIQAGWVEIREPSISWLGAPLPAGARLTPVATHASAARPLAA